MLAGTGTYGGNSDQQFVGVALSHFSTVLSFWPIESSGSKEQASRMIQPEESSNLPSTIAAGIAGIPAPLVPATTNALSRLVGAVVDIPIAWLEYQKAKIVSRTEGFRAVDTAVSQRAADLAGADDSVVERAMDNLLRKSYRQQNNKEAVAAAMIEDLREKAADAQGCNSEGQAEEFKSIDDDWLNVFERYAEDASTERMQQLWGRVLAGEVRKPGRYGMRTLRFLSEFSQSDAMEFSLFCENSFGDLAPNSLVKVGSDISGLLKLEAAGLIQGTSGLMKTFTFNPEGKAFIVELPLAIMITGKPETKLSVEMIALTPLGQELVSLLPDRNPKSAARTVANAIKNEMILTAILMRVDEKGLGTPIEVLWQGNDPTAPVATD